MKLRFLFALVLAIPTASACFYESGEEPCLEEPSSDSNIALYRNPYTGQCEDLWGSGSGGGGGFCEDGVEVTDRAPIPDWAICSGQCQGLTTNECLSADECRGIYISTCGGDVPCEQSETNYIDCWSIAPNPGFSNAGCDTYDADECSRHNECSAVHAPRFNGGAADFLFCTDETGANGPGSCTGEIGCRAEPPNCPEGTTPGIIDGCWSGFCIPLDQCEALPTCDGQAEESCVASGNCDPIYQGVNCVCEGDVCECERWDYESCEDNMLETPL